MDRMPLLRVNENDRNSPVFTVHFQHAQGPRKVEINASYVSHLDKLLFGQVHLWVAILTNSIPDEDPQESPTPQRARVKKRASSRP